MGKGIEVKTSAVGEVTRLGEPWTVEMRLLRRNEDKLLDLTAHSVTSSCPCHLGYPSPSYSVSLDESELLNSCNS